MLDHSCYLWTQSYRHISCSAELAEYDALSAIVRSTEAMAPYPGVRTQQKDCGAVSSSRYACRRVWVNVIDAVKCKFCRVTPVSVSDKAGVVPTTSLETRGGPSRVGPARRRLVSASCGCYGNDKHCAESCSLWAKVGSPTRRFQVCIPGRGCVPTPNLSRFCFGCVAKHFADTGSLSDVPFTQPVVIPGFCTTFQ